MAIGADFAKLQEKIKYEFINLTNLEAAMTHTSYANEMRSKGVAYKSNERLEFLGDAVLQIVISDYLYKNFAKYNEGVLTKMRQYLVCQKTLSKIAAEINLGVHLNVGTGEESSGVRKRPRILANALEALIAAIYVDAKEHSRDYVSSIVSMFEAEIKNAESMQWGDYKTLLQTLVEKSGGDTLEYVVEDESGPEHAKCFTVVAKISGNEVGRGTAPRLKDAQMNAAKMALSLFGIVL